MSSAQQEAVSRKACLTGNGCSLLKRHNAADGCFLLRPKGVPPVRQLGIAGLGKGTTIAGGLRLDLAHWGHSESINTTSSEYNMIAQKFVCTKDFLTEWNKNCISEGRKIFVGKKIQRRIVILVRISS